LPHLPPDGFERTGDRASSEVFKGLQMLHPNAEEQFPKSTIESKGAVGGLDGVSSNHSYFMG